MVQKVTQDDVSQLYADIYNMMKDGVAEATKLGKAPKFELADCSHNNILMSLCASDAAKRLGVAEKPEDEKMAELAKDVVKAENKPVHMVIIPCPVLIKNGAGNDRYSHLDTANMVRIAAEVYKIANAEKATSKTRIQKHALDFQPQGHSLAKP